MAGGAGKRMRCDRPKALLSTSEKPLILHILESAAELAPEKIIVVTGHQHELVKEIVGGWTKSRADAGSVIDFALQQPPLGTGHAVKSGISLLKDFSGTILVLYADVPLVQAETLRKFTDFHVQKKATISILSFASDGPSPCGRLIRDGAGMNILKIAEAGEPASWEAGPKEYNSGVMAVDSAFLEPAVRSLTADGVQHEYRLTDIVEKASSEGQTVVAFDAADPEELRNVNDQYDLTLLNRTLNTRRVRRFILSGVKIPDPSSVYLDPAVSIAPGASIGPSVQLRGATTIEKDAVIEGACLLQDVAVREGALIRLGVCAHKATIGPRAKIGPFAHLREGTILGEEVRVGNFVETKKAVLANGVKASHLTYLGDTTVGENTNVGAGTITCNYDGCEKYETEIGRNVFIGSNSALVAPVVIEDGATVGAGSVITKRVKKDSLALTRPPQITKENWSRTRPAKGRKETT